LLPPSPPAPFPPPSLPPSPRYFSDDDNRLLKKQKKAWGHIHDYFEKTHGVSVTLSSGLIKEDHPTETVETVTALVESLDIWELTGLHNLVMESKSILTSLAVVQRAIGSEAAYMAARVDEEYQVRDINMSVK
jgi:chaperone required for assembly of F1-ATPase